MRKKVLNYVISLTFLTLLFGGMFFLLKGKTPKVDTEKINQEIIELKKEQDKIVEMAEKTVDGIIISDSISKHKIDSLNIKNNIRSHSLKHVNHDLDSIKGLLDIYKKQIIDLKKSNVEKDETISSYTDSLIDLVIHIKKLKIIIRDYEKDNRNLKKQIEYLKEIDKTEEKIDSVIPQPTKNKNRLFKRN